MTLVDFIRSDKSADLTLLLVYSDQTTDASPYCTCLSKDNQVTLLIRILCDISSICLTVLLLCGCAFFLRFKVNKRKRGQQFNNSDSQMTDTPALQIAFYEPDIAPNVGTMLRFGACLGLRVHVIEPCGFPFSRRALKRSLMDYEAHIDLMHHADWNSFNDWRLSEKHRLILMTTKASQPYLDVEYKPGDILLAGSESTGAPDNVHEASDVRIRIPMRPNLRSVNVATACAVVSGEAMRQMGSFEALQ